MYFAKIRFLVIIIHLLPIRPLSGFKIKYKHVSFRIRLDSLEGRSGHCKTNTCTEQHITHKRIAWMSLIKLRTYK